MEIEIKEVSGIQEFVMKDDVITIEVRKRASDTGKNLPGATLQLLDMDRNVIEEWVTKDEPHKIEYIPEGKYVLHEKNVPEGYVFADDMEIEIKSVSEIQKFTMEDKKWGSITTSMTNYYGSHDSDEIINGIPVRGRLPKTGDDTNIILYIMLLLSSALVGSYTVYRMKRKQKKNKKLRLKKSIFFFLLIFTVSMDRNTVVFARIQETTEIAEYTTENKEEKYEGFANSIKKDGHVYNLTDIKYEMVKKTPIKEEKVITKNVESGYINKRKEYKPEETLIDNGIEFHLEDCTVLDGSEYRKTYTKTFDYLESDTDIPDNKVISVTDESGEEVEINAGLSDTERLPEGEWLDTDINITFDHYDSGVFNWQGLTIYDSGNPLEGYETELLQSVGADTNTYRIVSTDWNGDAYEVNGILYRNALAKAQYFVNYVRATYTGTLDYVKYQSTYIGKTEVDSTSDFKYTTKATAIYTMDNALTIQQIVVLASIGVLILILLIILILFVLSKRKKDNKKENDEKNVKKRRV